MSIRTKRYRGRCLDCKEEFAGTQWDTDAWADDHEEAFLEHECTVSEVKRERG